MLRFKQTTFSQKLPWLSRVQSNFGHFSQVKQHFHTTKSPEQLKTEAGPSTSSPELRRALHWLLLSPFTHKSAEVTFLELFIVSWLHEPSKMRFFSLQYNTHLSVPHRRNLTSCIGVNGVWSVNHEKHDKNGVWNGAAEQPSKLPRFKETCGS